MTPRTLTRLTVVETHPVRPERVEGRHPSLEEQARQTTSRLRWLKRELAFELARANIVRRRLADQRCVSFIRPEAFDAEFGS